MLNRFFDSAFPWEFLVSKMGVRKSKIQRASTPSTSQRVARSHHGRPAKTLASHHGRDTKPFLKCSEDFQNSRPELTSSALAKQLELNRPVLPVRAD
jgi:hypothetical protein